MATSEEYKGTIMATTACIGSSVNIQLQQMKAAEENGSSSEEIANCYNAARKNYIGALRHLVKMISM